MRKLLLAAAALGLTLFWACRVSPTDVQDHFDVIGDSAWTACDSVTVVLYDKDGKTVDTLFNDVLTDLDQLKNLSAARYDGTKAALVITGKKSGGLCFEEKRTFEGDGQSVVIDTVKSASALIQSVAIDPDSLSIPLGGIAVAVKASVKPGYADQNVAWSLAGDGVVSLDLPSGGDGSLVKVHPRKIGETDVTVRSRKDSTRTAVLHVRVTAPSGIQVALDKDSVVVYAGGGSDSVKAAVLPASASQKVEWKSLNPDVAAIDSLGHIKPLSVGETYVQAKSIANGVYASAHVAVLRDVPVLTVASKTGAPVNTDIIFSPKAVQAYGIIAMYKWDVDGDGAWDDSIANPGVGLGFDLPPQTAKYAKEGAVTARFYVRDGEGNEVTAPVLLDIGNQAPEITVIRNDTDISIKDSIAMTAKVRDVDGKVSWCGWDYDGDGVYEDSLATADSAVEIVLGHRYPDAGSFLAILKVEDENGKARLDTVKVKVELDRPKADLGPDFSVTVGAPVAIHAKGTDKFGKIIRRELRVLGAGSGFRDLSGEDTALTAPADPGALTVVLKVTDDDSLTDVDTLNVTVIAINTFTLTAGANAGGSIQPSGIVNINNGQNQVFTLVASAGNRLKSVTVDGADATVAAAAAGGTYTFTNVTANHAINAAFIKVDTVTTRIVGGTGGSITPIKALVDEGADTVFTVSPSNGFKLDSFKVDGVNAIAGLNGNKYAFHAINGNHAIEVTFVQGFTLTGIAQGGGTITPTSVGVNLGDSVAFTITTNPGYKISGLLDNGIDVFSSLVGKTYTIHDISAAHKVDVSFIQQFTITLDVSGTGDGTAEPAAGVLTLNAGASKTYKFNPDAVSKVTSLKVDGVAQPVATSYLFSNLAANRTISVVFTKVTFPLTAKVTSGSGTLDPTAAIVDSLGSQTFKFSPGANNRFVELDDNGVAAIFDWASGQYTLTSIKAKHDITVQFWRQYNVTAVDVVGGVGKITPQFTIVDADAPDTVLIEPAPDYRVKGVTDNDVDVPFTGPTTISTQKYVLSKVKADHKIAAAFIQYFTVTTSSNDPKMGTITPASMPSILDYQGSADFLIAPVSGYYLDSLIDNGKNVTSSVIGNVYTISNAVANHTLSATFAKSKGFTLTVDYSVDESYKDPVLAVPEVCITVGEKEDCGKAPFTLTFDSGTDFSIKAPPSIDLDCGDCEGSSVGFTEWQQLTDGEPMTLDQTNPSKSMPLKDNLSIQAFYSKPL